MRLRHHSKRRVLQLALHLSMACVSVQGQEVFFAREFLLTRQFKPGVDVWPGEPPPVALHSMGFYAAGTFQTGYGSSLGPPDFQGLLRSYDLAGNELWTRQIPAQGAVCSSCPPSNGAFPTAMAADGAAVYVAGHVGFGNTDVFVRKYDQRGNELWSRQLRMSDTGNNVGGMGVDSSGIYIAAWNYDSQAFLRKYSPAGDEIWTRPLAARTLKGVAVNGSGLYV